MSIRTDIELGLLDIWPAALAAVPIGLLFGALAASKGLSPFEVLLMSGLVAAGGAQFAAVELWATPTPVAAIVFSTLLINARHVLMGASLSPKLHGFSLPQKLLGVVWLVDENWAMAERRARTHRLTPAYWFAVAIPLIAGWLVTTTLGATIGAALGDPRRLGADFAFTALFIALVAAFWKGRVTGWTVAAAGVSSALTFKFAGSPWHVPVGAICGLAAAWFVAGQDADAGVDASAARETSP